MGSQSVVLAVEEYERLNVFKMDHVDSRETVRISV